MWHRHFRQETGFENSLLVCVVGLHAEVDPIHLRIMTRIDIHDNTAYHQGCLIYRQFKNINISEIYDYKLLV